MLGQSKQCLLAVPFTVQKERLDGGLAEAKIGCARFQDKVSYFVAGKIFKTQDSLKTLNWSNTVII
jgi:hypothetical protein